jgi:phage antirepressor YoqD-like protein
MKLKNVKKCELKQRKLILWLLKRNQMYSEQRSNRIRKYKNRTQSMEERD